MYSDYMRLWYRNVSICALVNQAAWLRPSDGGTKKQKALEGDARCVKSKAVQCQGRGYRQNDKVIAVNAIKILLC